MRKLLLALCCLAGWHISGAQSETHDFITYDTLYNIGYANLTYRLRITRPRNLFKANHPDTASRPAIITMPGQGEMGTNYSKLGTYGPHYWLYRNKNQAIDSSNGWDGGITLGNGKHYPILITMICSSTYPGARENYMVLKYLIDRYHIKSNSVHLAGLSQGAFTWSSMIAYEETAGAETGMKAVTSLTLLQGTASELPNPYASWSKGFAAFGVWAQKYKGKLFGLEGTYDGRDVWRAQIPMNTSAPGSAYFAFEDIGGGGHCCWNSMYDPNRTNFTSVGTLAPNISSNRFYPNSMGTYKAGSNLFTWMLRQGDTSLVGGSAVFTVNAGNDQSIRLPLSNINLSSSITLPIGQSILSYQWTKVSGGNATITNPGNASTSVTGLTEGVYVFRLTVTSIAQVTLTDDITVTVAAAANVAPVSNAGSAQTITLPVSNITLNGTGSDADGSITEYRWTKTSGGSATITNPTAASTTVTGLAEGNYVFSLAVKDNLGASSSATVNISVLPIVTSSKVIPGKIEAESYDAFNGVNTENTTDIGGGNNVGWIDTGDWMDYAVSVASAGNFKVDFRVAATNAGAKLQLKKSDGSVLATVDVPSTGGFQSWATVSAVVALPAGNQVLRVFSVNSINWNINWINFTVATAPIENPVVPIPGVTTRIEAERYSSMSGVQNEVTYDVNGGLNVGYIDFKDWMDYAFTAPVTGIYTFNFRIAAPSAGAQLQIKSGNGTVLSTVNLSQTGGYQTWQTVSTMATLQAGAQTIRIYSSASANWNFNWLEITSPSSEAAQAARVLMVDPPSLVSPGTELVSEGSSVGIFPNPVSGSFVLSVHSEQKGILSIKITDLNGKVVNSYKMDKPGPGAFQANLSASGLGSGLYFVSVRVGTFFKTIKIIKP